MKLELLKVGSCKHPEAIIIPGRSFRSIEFPSVVGVIHHPQAGIVLFDTGYADRFSEVVRHFPEKLYAMVTPFNLNTKDQLLFQLAERDIQPADVKYIFISHFHADHVAGLKDFPNAMFICSKTGLEAVLRRGRLLALTKGYIKSLLPDDMIRRTKFIEESKVVKLPAKYYPFDTAFDLFDDGSLFSVSLPGHADGHYGLLLENKKAANFLVGDACWLSESYEKRVYPNRLSYLVMSNAQAYRDTLSKLGDLYCSNSNVNIIPSHCSKKFEEFYLC